MRHVLSVLIVALIGILLIAACNDGEEQGVNGDGQPADGVSVQVADFAFGPATLDAEPGQALTVNLKNEGQANHTFTIDELGINEALQPGEEAVVTVTPTEEGNLRFYCQFHGNAGMEGTLSVGAASGDSSEAPSGSPMSGGGYFSGY